MRSQPACGERRPASGVPAPDSADMPEGADRAASAAAGERGPVRPTVPPSPPEPARLLEFAPADLSQPRPGVRGARLAADGPDDLKADDLKADDRRADAPPSGDPATGDLRTDDAAVLRSQFLPGVCTTRLAGCAGRFPAKFSFWALPPAKGNGAAWEAAGTVRAKLGELVSDSRSFGTRRAEDGFL